MRAAVCTKYGTPDVLEIQEVDKPTPKANEILVKIVASTVTAGDYRIRSLDVPAGFGLLSRLAMGISKPRNAILGAEYSGIVESIGTDVTEFKEGDAVWGITGVSLGTNAEFIAVSANSPVILKPEALSFEECAAIPFGATTALMFVM